MTTRSEFRAINAEFIQYLSAIYIPEACNVALEYRLPYSAINSRWTRKVKSAQAGSRPLSPTAARGGPPLLSLVASPHDNMREVQQIQARLQVRTLPHS